MDSIRRLATCVATMALGLTAAAAQAPENLARVAILTYEDETRTNNFGYMPASLTEAIDKSLQQRFSYVREEPSASEQHRRDIREKGLFTARDAALYCSKNNVQFIVFGKLNFDPQTKKLKVTTYISQGTDKIRTLKERSNATDATIFALADKVADDIVAEFAVIARDQPVRDATATAGKKVELARVVDINWALKNYHLYAGIGASIPTGAAKNALKTGVLLGFTGKYLFWRGLFGSINGTVIQQSLRNSTGTDPKLVAFSVLGGGGYAFFFWSDRFRWDIGLGIGVAAHELKENDQTVNGTKHGGAAFRVATSLSWMMTDRFSLLLEISATQLNNTEYGTLRYGGLMLGAGYAYY
jgi:TolB-like protein